MKTTLCALALVLAACTDEPSDLDLARHEAQPTWDVADTLHEGAHLVDHVDVNARRVHSLWIAGSNMNHVPLVVNARSTDAHDLRIAVLGPIVNGTRAVLGADGYATHKRDVSVALDISEPGEHLVVIGSYDLANAVSYEVSAMCTDECGVSRYDVLATPKDGALVGDAQRNIQMILGDVMVGHESDLDVEMWASPPLQWSAAQKIATFTTSDTHVDAIVPASVNAGDDLRFVVRDSGGRLLDSGITTRFAPTRTGFARLDSIQYGSGLEISGVAPFFEGISELRLYSESREATLASVNIHADAPGAEGNGYGAFDAAFALPSLPHAGELLSIGYINGNGEYRRFGCFEYAGVERSCP